ncbi:hypothetical protein B0E46_07850 [Rhodanobacter sp. B04]|uniref:hypothetical protein n=1 Tax=Rhodanobacter sp. B04 TaxID=1945860 RepID=UPI00098456D8|nr:hypothetical protein [Rhodanobacter sp. B04]OOG63855.1 hypothetical protein B0E46_07850 [Rhodanobacter sp. B04]
MTEWEQAVNRDLRALDEAHRLGRITRADYRARRRKLLQSLHDSSNVVTARKALVHPDALTAPRARHAQTPSGEASNGSGKALTTLLSMRPAIAWKPLLALAAGVVVLILLTWWLLRGE